MKHQLNLLEKQNHSKTKKLVVILMAFIFILFQFTVLKVGAVGKTFDFESGMSGSTMTGDPSGANKTVSQDLSGHTLVITQDQGNILYMNASDYNGSARTALSGVAVIMDATYGTSTKLTLTVAGGYTFDLNALNGLNQSGGDISLKFTTSKGNVVKTLSDNDGNGATIDLSAEWVLKGVTSVEITQNGGGNFLIELDNVVLDNITAPLAQVTGVSLSSSGVANWNNVANESSFDVQLYKGGVAEGSVVNVPANTLSYDFLSAMRSAGAGDYTVKVTAKGDGVTYSDGPQSTASGSQTIAVLSTVSAGLTWIGDVANWTSVANAVSYDVQLYKDGSTVDSAINVLSENVASGIDFVSLISSNGSGTYTYKVTAKADSTSLYLNAAQSGASNDNTKLDQVTNVVLSTAGVASWDDVAKESSFDVQLYKDGITEGSVVNVPANTLSYDFLSAMRSAGVGEYTVKVTAKGNGTTSFDGAQSPVSISRTIVQLSTVSAGLTWTGNVAHWTGVANGVSYDVQLYKDGNPIGAPINVLSANVASGADFSSLIGSNGGGTYTYKVAAKGNVFLILDASVSAASNNNVVATPLAQVTGVSLSSSGVANWNNVDNESGFDVQLYKGGVAEGSVVNVLADTLSYDFLSAMRGAGTGVYTVKVTAKGDGLIYSDGTQSAESGSQTIAALSTVSAGLTWTGDVANWTSVANAVSYDVQLYKDGGAVGSATNVLSANVASGVDFASDISSNGSGTYTYKVTAKADSASLYLNAAQSGDSNDNTKLAQVTNVVLSIAGVASWDDVANESSFDVRLYKDGITEGSVVNVPANTLSHDFLSAMRSAGAGEYTVKVTAKGNGTTSFDGAQSPVSNSREIIQLSTVSAGLTWTGNVANWTGVATAVSYDVQLYKDGSAIGSSINVLSANIASGVDFGSNILSNGSGTYTYKVTAKGNVFLILDASVSAVSNNNIVATPLAQVTGVSLSSSGVASWDNVDNESSFDVQLYKNGVAVGSVVNVPADTLSYDFLSAMRSAGAGDYTVKVTAKGDGVTYSNGPQSTASGSQTIAVLLTVSAGLTWTGDVAHWTSVANAVSYDVQLYKDGSAVGSATNVLSANAASGVDFGSAISSNGSGTYIYKVTARGDNILLLNANASANSNDRVITTGGVTTPSSGGGSSLPQTNLIVEVNGQKQDAGVANTQTVGGQTTTTITVDDTKLEKFLQNGTNQTVTLLVNGTPDALVSQLNGQTVKNMEQKETVLEVKTLTTTYTLPATEINIDDISQQLGSKAALKDIKVSVSITEPSADTVKIVESTANKNSYQLVVKPVEFEITCSNGEKTIEVSKFNSYVGRTFAIPDAIDPSKITTGIVLNSDGTFSHVPTTVYKDASGKYFAKINSLTNSTYSVIYNPVSFKDVAGHWAKNAINDLGSRLVVSGAGNGNYEPNRSITRAEFAAIVVRALGLKQAKTESAFDDVTLSDWFNGYVETATAYGLIKGYSGSTDFGPNDNITREQAMAILARAMKVAGLSSSLTETESSDILSRYTDSVLISDYAKTGIAAAVKNGIVQGNGKSTLLPRAEVTRAEVATMVQLLLQKTKLI